MSGREPEPIAAFFPSIDRNLIRDLGRQLRNAPPMAAVPEPAVEDQPEPLDASASEGSSVTPQQHGAAAARPSTADILGAVEQAATAMTDMSQRIAELESKTLDLEATNAQLKGKLGELLQLRQTAEAAARSERERAERAEQIAAQHLSRSQELESDLENALGDLTRVAEAITGTLGAGYRRG